MNSRNSIATPGCSALGGLITKRERWGLSWAGWAAFFSIAALLTIVAWLAIFPFLAVTQPLTTEYLVIEGWISQAAVRSAADEIRNGRYSHIYTTGGPVLGTGPYSNDYNTSASVGRSRLLKLGIPDAAVQMVPSRVRDRDRTYSAALALSSWLRKRNIRPSSINVFTESVHARRSQLLFQRALGPSVEVGIIAAPPDEYPSNRWWRYSEGIKEVLSEAAAYFYVRLFFWPSA